MGIEKSLVGGFYLRRPEIDTGIAHASHRPNPGVGALFCCSDCDFRWHLLSIDDQASMVSKLDYGENKDESWLHFLYKSQLNRPPGSKAQVSDAPDRTARGRDCDMDCEDIPSFFFVCVEAVRLDTLVLLL